MWSLKLMAIFVILGITLIAGFYPFFRKATSERGHSFPIGESLASGVFLGAGLLHMLGESSHEFFAMGYEYPLAFLIAGAVFLAFLLLEHIGRELYQHQGANSNAFAVLAVIMLCVHSFFTGATLGIVDSTSVVFVILLAVLAHKWAESFALAIQINKSHMRFTTGILLFIVFSLMVPAGIIFGSVLDHLDHQVPLLEPIFGSIAAGTFLYLGTLHGLEQATLIKECCNLPRFYYVIAGFSIMAVVAIWT